MNEHDIVTECIDSIEGFLTLRPEWDAVYDLDGQSNIYLSWGYLKAVIDLNLSPWFVLAFKAKKLNLYVGFSFFSERVGRYNWHRALYFAATPIADYGSFLSMPKYSEAVCASAAQFIQNLQWDKLVLRNIYDARLPMFTGYFSHQRYQKEFHIGTSLYIPLPGTWDIYLQTQISKNMRKKIRRYTREIEQLPNYRIEALNKHNVEQLTQLTVQMWYDQWASFWPIDTFHINLHLLQSLAAEKMLWLTAIFDGDTPIATLAGILDYPRKTFFALIGGYNKTYAHMHPGKILDAHSIRWAIDNGFKTYDYMQGAYSYKISFGAIRRMEVNVEISRKSWRSKMANYLKSLKDGNKNDSLFAEGDPL